tara:strand:+ start:1262 stop:1429 length:168 start_codon:yes stop_codon:yes gene_type:complete
MKKIKTKIYERKDGQVKIYNGHMGTFAWEAEEAYEDLEESDYDKHEQIKEQPDSV